jgi:hypothetical protein
MCMCQPSWLVIKTTLDNAARTDIPFGEFSKK